jgi:DNA repair protein RadC
MSAPASGPTRISRGPRRGRLAQTPVSERPREKLFAKGAGALSDEELVALLLGTGRAGKPVMESAHELLQEGGFPRLFARGGAELRSLFSGIGAAKAARLEAVVEIGRRLLREPLSSNDVLADPRAAALYLMAVLAPETREVMGALLLDSRNRLVKNVTVFSGTASHASVSPSPLFRHAILAGATGVVLYHNHPSGDPEPSPEDRATTDRFAAAGREIGIEVKDHLVLGRGRWVSFHERGLLPTR